MKINDPQQRDDKIFEAMRSMSGRAFKVWLATFVDSEGYHTPTKEIMARTGIKFERNIYTDLKWLRENGWLGHDQNNHADMIKTITDQNNHDQNRHDQNNHADMIKTIMPDMTKTIMPSILTKKDLETRQAAESSEVEQQIEQLIQHPKIENKDLLTGCLNRLRSGKALTDNQLTAIQNIWDQFGSTSVPPEPAPKWDSTRFPETSTNGTAEEVASWMQLINDFPVKKRNA